MRESEKLRMIQRVSTQCFAKASTLSIMIIYVPVIITHVVLRPLHLRVRVSDHISNVSHAGNYEFLTSCFVIIVDELLENPG